MITKEEIIVHLEGDSQTWHRLAEQLLAFSEKAAEEYHSDMELIKKLKEAVG
jgi:hypothetical protein